MPVVSLITNERQEREVGILIEQITDALSSEHVLKSIVDGLPSEVIDGVRRSLTVERKELVESLQAYQKAQRGEADELKSRAGDDLGALLVAARVAKGWKQKELARRLFLPEQQVQRYEAERYRSISLGNLIRVARTLGVRLTADISKPVHEPWLPSYEMTLTELQKVLKHARAHGWLDRADQTDESGISQLRRTVAEHVGEYGTPSLLRTGLNVTGHTEDWLLLAWKAQVTRAALKVTQRNRVKYRPLHVSWLNDLVQLSSLDDGPVQARALLFQHGIVLVTEPQIPGMKIDGAAFLVDEVPVIGMTLRLDTIDNFWFTLLHEVAHVILHYRTGLSSGFFDDVDNPEIDELEVEANQFASAILIPDEIWRRSPARITKTAEPIERLAKQLRIAPAIVFGRVRMERQNYKLFPDKIGRGQVRKQFFSQISEVNHEPGT
ncbi:XRE family transcriptional regulator [Mesorhizobium sp. WSM4311]|uniref:XRE family transcriptional regulator n=1 Tax=Mesorhizobium sp. WSM4311 TaxID=2029410 RepID=UPI001AEC77FB|nr:XRE family transcriptional regulator [Mesorhizobium sp. WSM4311]